MPRRSLNASCSLIAACATLVSIVPPASTRASAQCPPDWHLGEGRPGVTGDVAVTAAARWDPDGDGPQPELLVIGGVLDGAGDLPVQGLAAWNGATWRDLDAGIQGQVFALAVFRGDLIAAGNFLTAGGVPAVRIARYDGQAWHPLGSGISNAVRALAVYNDELYAAGIFSQAGGVNVSNIARWDGEQWRAVGAGVPNGVLALTVFSGELLAGTVGVRRWNGSDWQSLGNIGGAVSAFTTHNGELVAGGSFTSPATRVARWDGQAWQPFGTGTSDAVYALASYNGELIAGGIFTNAGGVPAPNRIARWNGAWSSIDAGPGIPARSVWALSQYQGELIACGASTRPSGLLTSQVGRWDGANWRHLGGGIDSVVYRLTTFNDELIAAGLFQFAGDTAAKGIARRAGDAWQELGGGVSGGYGYVFDAVPYAGSLVVTGSFTTAGTTPAHNVARWDGDAWHAFGSNSSVLRLLVHNGALYGTGSFGTSTVGRWNDDKQLWEPVGVTPPGVGMAALAVWNGQLAAGGLAGGGAPATVYRFDGATWQPVGQHLGYNFVQSLAVYEGELIAGGYFDPTYGGPPHGIARFDGATWEPLGGGLFANDKFVLAVFDMRVYDGELIVAGSFTHAGSAVGLSVYNVVRWNGAQWLALGSGANDAATTLHEYAGKLVVGGWFSMAGGRPNGHWATWGPRLVGDLDGDLVVGQSDLGILLSAFGSCPGDEFHNTAAGALAGDACVTQGDLGVLLSAFGTSCP